MAFAQPFDLYYWFVTTFSGNTTIFIAIAFLFIAVLSAYFRMPNIVTLCSFALFSGIVLIEISGDLWILSLILAGIFFAWSLSRVIK